MTIQEERGIGEAMFLQVQEGLGSIAQLALEAKTIHQGRIETEYTGKTGWQGIGGYLMFSVFSQK